ncbi:MAG TPA: hypothetical protein VLC46_08985 [Thermoanaerobaculia bacterium]|nr:hypothetical protein [Thermoanaerobaculia bacterium]
MLKGAVQMTLMIGPAVPRPVGQGVLDALQSVKVTSRAREASGFSLVFSLSNGSPLQTLFLLAGGASIPLVRVVIVVTVNGSPNVLIDGVMTHHEITPGADASHSTLTILGDDLTKVMGYIDFSGIPYPACPVEARVALVLAKYAMFGIIPKIIPSIMFDVPLPTQRIPRQKGNDLAYIRQLADEVGYVFYLEPGPQPGMSFAYWGPEIKVGVPQPALNVDMDAFTNVEQMTFRFAADNRKLPVITIQNLETKVPIKIPVPDVTPLNPPLGMIPPIPKAIEPLEMSAKLSPIQAVLIGLAKAARSFDAASGHGTLNVARYGRVLKPRQLVGVRGVGTAFDGLYYVDEVTHDIQRGEYKQDFSLVRNGLVSTVQQVPA